MIEFRIYKILISRIFRRTIEFFYFILFKFMNKFPSMIVINIFLRNSSKNAIMYFKMQRDKYNKIIEFENKKEVNSYIY